VGPRHLAIVWCRVDDLASQQLAVQRGKKNTMANNILQEKLDHHGISQADLSKACGVSVGTINKTCRKRKTPAPRTKSKIVAGLTVLCDTEYTVDQIFRDEIRA
jgi:DNA-binding XRE family transcriptional regulator